MNASSHFRRLCSLRPSQFSLVAAVLFATFFAANSLVATNARGDDPPPTADKPAADKPLAEQTPQSVLVTFEHEEKMVAIRLDQESQMAVLESCFPNYRSRPAGEGQVLWKPKYEIYFNFARGQTVRVAVSSNSRYWTTGQGAIELRGGYFSNFVHELLKEKARPRE